MPKVLILTDEAVEDREMAYPYYRLQEAGYTVEVVGPERGKTYTGGRGLPFTADLGPDDVRIDDYDAVIVPAGRSGATTTSAGRSVGQLAASFRRNISASWRSSNTSSRRTHDRTHTR